MVLSRFLSNPPDTWFPSFVVFNQILQQITLDANNAVLSDISEEDTGDALTLGQLHGGGSRPTFGVGLFTANCT